MISVINQTCIDSYFTSFEPSTLCCCCFKKLLNGSGGLLELTLPQEPSPTRPGLAWQAHIQRHLVAPRSPRSPIEK